VTRVDKRGCLSDDTTTAFESQTGSAIQGYDKRFSTTRTKPEPAGYVSVWPRLRVLAALVAISAAPAAASDWAFPGLGVVTGASAPRESDVMRLPGSPVILHQSNFDGARAVDWFPNTHPPAPEVVLNAKGKGGYPCGYCHLPDGRGRPENARLQGLPAGYIVEQVKAFANGTRRAAVPYMPTRYMAEVAHAIEPADLQAAAAYFSQFEPQSHTQVVEAVTIPAAAAWHFVYRFDRLKHEALGQRIIEGPVDDERFELRDPEARYIAYVPKGAVTRGRVIAEHGASGGPACVSCHGQALIGIAGASPTFLARQLMDFRSKARNDPSAAPMQAVAGQLTDAQIIDASAYVGSRGPWTRAEMGEAMNAESVEPPPRRR
jgi:cytochrome c553